MLIGYKLYVFLFYGFLTQVFKNGTSYQSRKKNPGCAAFYPYDSLHAHLFITSE